MPNGARLHIAELRDDFEQMIHSIESSYFNDLANFQSEKRKKQVLYTRLYLAQQDLSDSFFYDINGKPQLQHGYISISHCQNLIAIYLHPNHTIGIDIEHFHEKVKRVAPRFMNDQERKRFPDADLQMLTLMWSAKEAVFKKYGGETTYFASIQDIININSAQQTIQLKIKKDTVEIEELLNYQIFEDFVLVFST